MELREDLKNTDLDFLKNYLSTTTKPKPVKMTVTSIPHVNDMKFNIHNVPPDVRNY
jgi:hypothetical protein